ncbi:restriction endonuclease subunit S [Mesorhizobium sp.]|uniref:restriction endonuclease subunit S n=1 Tax=Mesorhizobium sp. TaxID=1871066 RepID=UPI001220951E|nr:restriction endonuclease subunit S [Mesorhizobium sp.]TIN05772.1 MAG: hypothetical protein E5Y14_31825 [Mesorhizobium sp.]
MNALPLSWSWADLGTLADVQWGSTSITKSSYVASGYAAFSATGHDGMLSHFEHDGPGIVLSAIGARCGKCFRADGQWTAIKKTITIAQAAVERDYLFPYLNDEDRWPNKGGAQPFITLAAARSVSVPIPPLLEQRRIVTKIDSLTGKSKRARDQLDHIPRLVEKYKQAVLAAAFRGDLTREWRADLKDAETADALVARTEEPDQSRGGREATTNVKPGVAGLSVNDPGLPTPEGWAWVRLRRIARQETGHTPSRSKAEYWDGGIPWVGIRDAGSHHGTIIEQTLQTVSQEGLTNSSARLLPTGTVCLSRTASVGYVTIMGRPMATSQDFATWTCTNALLPKYLMYALMAEGENIREFGEGSTHTTIYFPEIRALHICLAPSDEQHEIVRRIETSLAWIDRLASETTSARKLIDRLDQAVLAKAFRGELVPQDPSDEPASVLLERIRAERGAAPKAKRGRRAGA